MRYRLGFGLAILIISVAALILFLLPEKTEYKKVTVGNVTITAEVARTAAQKLHGLSNRKSLAENTGMIFVYDTAERQSFWMKDMNFPIDILWIRDTKVVSFNENLSPLKEDSLRIYKSAVPVNYVLEVPAGFVKANKIKYYDQVIVE